MIRIIQFIIFPDIQEIISRLNEIADRQMNATLESQKAAVRNIKKAQVQGIVLAPVILDYVKQNHIDLVVMVLMVDGAWGHLLLGSVAEEVVRLATCPVFTVKVFGKS
jgi:nucleotide-binding universal stress UspA family protein